MWVPTCWLVILVAVSVSVSVAVAILMHHHHPDALAGCTIMMLHVSRGADAWLPLPL
jgi:hypothetical protein